MATFFEELKRRNVVRIGIAYLVFAWLIVQVGELILGAFGAPAWALQTLIVMVALGLPLALFLAWAFEITPEGIQKTSAKGATTKGARHRRSKVRTLDILIVAFVFVGLTYMFGKLLYQDAGHQDVQEGSIPAAATAPPPRRSIAVLPFVNLSSDSDRVWFADGLTEEILNALARTPDLRVAARTSSYAFRNSSLDIRSIAQQLGVAYVLEGSVRRGQDRLRVTAQLIDARDGLHLWSKNYDLALSDVIDIQEDIATRIAVALRTATDPEALKQMVSTGTTDADAFEAYLRGLAYDASALDSGDYSQVLEARNAYEQAVQLDPQFAKAWWRLSNFWIGQFETVSVYSGLTSISRPEIFARYHEAVDNAIRLSRDPVSRIRYQAEKAYAGMNYSRALQLSGRYIGQRPNDYDAQILHMLLLTVVGNYHEAGKTAVNYQRTDGYNVEVTINSITALLSDDYASLRHLVDVALERFGEHLGLIYQAHRGYLWAGDPEKAATLLPAIRASDIPGSSKRIAELRQACADRRLREAESVYAEILAADQDRVSVIWLSHKIMGEEANAAESLAPLDDKDDLTRIAAFLFYSFFDVRNYPILQAHLARQQIDRGEPLSIPYRCNRQTDDVAGEPVR